MNFCFNWITEIIIKALWDFNLRMGDDAIHFENLLIGVSLGDVELAYHGCPVALTTAAAEVKKQYETCCELSNYLICVSIENIQKRTLTQQNSVQQ